MWIDELDTNTYELLYKAIEPLEAQELLVSMKVSDWPNIKKEDRQKIHRSVYRSAYKTSQEKVVTTEDFAAIINSNRG